MEFNSVAKLKRVIPRGLHPYLGALRRWGRARPVRMRIQKQRLLDDPSLGATERELLLKASSKIHYNDGMYDGDGDHYYKVGLSAIRNIDEALELVGLANPRNILDLPCGYGRVLRFLVHRFPAANITAGELDAGAVDFCVREFGASPAYSSPDLALLSLPARFDLIWCGSLVTHLNAVGIRALLAFFARHLVPGGLMIFTTHGERAIQRMLVREFEYGIEQEIIPSLISSCRETGFGYADYPNSRDYGVSLTSPEWIREQTEELSLKEVYFRARGWDDHQDVYGFTLKNREQ